MSELSSERREALAQALSDTYWDARPKGPEGWADALAPLVAGWLADAWDEGWEANDFRVRSFENPYREADDA